MAVVCGVSEPGRIYSEGEIGSEFMLKQNVFYQMTCIR